jgi:hypothetical protein
MNSRRAAAMRLSSLGTRTCAPSSCRAPVSPSPTAHRWPSSPLSMLVVTILLGLPAVSAACVSPVVSPPTGAGEHYAEAQGDDLDDIRVSGMQHSALECQQWLTRNQMARIGMGMPSTSPSTYFMRTSSSSVRHCTASTVTARFGPTPARLPPVHECRDTGLKSQSRCGAVGHLRSLGEAKEFDRGISAATLPPPHPSLPTMS